MKKLFLFLTFIALIINKPQLAQAQDEVVIDKVVAIVGGNAILYSDVENQYQQYLMQGMKGSEMEMKCSIFEDLLFSKLMLNQAELDSVVVSDDQVETEMDRRLQYFIQQIGSREKLENYYDKSIIEIKDELRKTIKDQMLIRQVQSGITENVKITPSEVSKYYKSLSKDSIPRIESELQFAEIVKYPVISKEEKELALEKIKNIRKRIVKDNESFSTLAKVYSEDPGSAAKGGELGEFSRGVMYPEFEAASFELKTPGEISEVVKTKAGYHIIQLIERKGEYINVRHILIQTQVTELSLRKAKASLDSIYKDIQAGKYTFEEAAKKFSESDTKVNQGLVTNSNNGSNVFLAEELDKQTYFALSEMNVGEISRPVIFQDEEGNQTYRLLKLLKRTDAHKADLDRDYARIKELALQEKKNEALGEWIEERAKNTYIIINDDDFNKCNLNYNWF